MKSFTMMVTTCIVYSILQYFLKLVVRRFTRRGRLAMVEYDDHRNIIQGKSLSMFQFLACKEENLNTLFSRQVGLNMSLHQTSGFDSTERKASINRRCLKQFQ